MLVKWAKVLESHGYKAETYGDVIIVLEFLEEKGLLVFSKNKNQTIDIAKIYA